MTATNQSANLPPWLKKRLPTGSAAHRVRGILSRLQLNTVCNSALCPNACECFDRGTATFLIMGPNCTRDCSFCAVDTGDPLPLDTDEPLRVAEAAKELGLRHVVVTSVTRDDLPDGGAGQFASTIRAVRRLVPDAAVEVLVPDFGGLEGSIETVVEAGPDVFNHNVETVRRLYPRVRPQADYNQSLEVLRHAAGFAQGRILSPRGGSIVTKSGLMVGLGETSIEVEEVFADLRRSLVSIVTVGQYLRPSARHLPVERFVTPGEFESLRLKALDRGLDAAFCGPFVRSSYHAGEVFDQARKSARAAQDA